MKKKSFLLLTLLWIVNTVAAQTTIAKFKYEAAEEAYLKKDYKLAITRLDEAEAILKATNPRILYLRIMAQSNMIKDNPDMANALINLESVRKLTGKYLKDYESIPDNEDKYRDVYNVSEQLQEFADSIKEREATRIAQAEANREKAEIYAATSAARNALKEAQKAEKQASAEKLLVLMNSRIDSLASAYGFRWEMPLKDLLQSNTNLKDFTTSKNLVSEGKYERKAVAGSAYTNGPSALTFENDVVKTYSFYINTDRKSNLANPDFIKKKAAEMLVLFPGLVRVVGDWVLISLDEKFKNMSFYKIEGDNGSAIEISFY